MPRRATVPTLPPPRGRRSPRADPVAAARQAERLAKLRAWRCGERVAALLAAVRLAAAGQDNVLYPMKEALAAGATIGEVSDTLRGTPTTAQAPF
ncbi:methylmalonyl-CoA mutase family protein [Streptomyces sp. NPDC054834]